MKKQLKSHLAWLHQYDRTQFRADFIAGLIVFVFLVPQGMAYASLAGLSPIWGLYASTIPLIVYACFGSSRHLSVGPVAIVSLLVLTGLSAYAEPGSAEFHALALTLSLLVGVLLLILGLLKVGFVTKFFSHAVISGYTSAAAIIIMASQLPGLLGVTSESNSHLLWMLVGIWQKLPDIHWWSFGIGLGSMLVIILIKTYFPRLPGPLLVVIGAIGVVYLFDLDTKGVQTAGEVPQGFPPFTIPGVQPDTLYMLLPTAVIIAFLLFMESYAIAKVVAAKGKYKIDANKELRGLGLGNVTGAFFSSFPVSGSFSRTAVNYNAGGKTPLVLVWIAMFMLLTLMFFTSLLFYLPVASLAAIIIVTVYGLINFREFRHLYWLKKDDGIILMVTFFSTLFIGVKWGILIGVAVSLLLMVNSNARPHIAEVGYLEDEHVFRNVLRYERAKRFPNMAILRLDASLYFMNCTVLERYMYDLLEKRPDIRTFILDMSGVNDIDAVTTDYLGEMIDELKERGVELLFANTKGPVRDVLYHADWVQQQNDLPFFSSIELALKSKGIDGLTGE